MLDFLNKNKLLFGSLLFSMSLLTGCATSSGTYSAEQCPQPPAKSAEYVIGPGDMLQVVVWRSEELSAEVPVRPDGRISTPLIEDIEAAGKTPSGLAKDMEVVLAEYLRSPRVSIIVVAQGASNQIQVVGEINVPQSLSYRSGIRVLDVIVGAGGLTEFAAGNRASLVRDTEVGQIKCNVKLKDLLAGDMTQNILVFAGDVLVIPEARF